MPIYIRFGPGITSNILQLTGTTTAPWKPSNLRKLGTWQTIMFAFASSKDSVGENRKFLSIQQYSKTFLCIRHSELKQMSAL